MLTATTENDKFPYIQGICLYRIKKDQKNQKNEIREWAILNGMNAGRFTSFWGAPCVGDTYDSLLIAEAMMEQDPSLITKYVTISIVEGDGPTNDSENRIQL